MKTKRIVITGGPSTGKTVIVDLLESLGFYCFHEVVRAMTLKAKEEGGSKKIASNPLNFVDDPAKFNQILLEHRLSHFKQADELKEQFVFYDRGIPDVLAYMDFFKQEYKTTDYTQVCKEHQYDKIFLLPPWKDIYVCDNERLESFEEALEIYHHLNNRYTALGYTCIEVPIGTITNRTNFILENI